MCMMTMAQISFNDRIHVSISLGTTFSLKLAFQVASVTLLAGSDLHKILELLL